MSDKMTFSEMLEYLRSLSVKFKALDDFNSSSLSLVTVMGSNKVANIITDYFEDLRQTQYPFLRHAIIKLEHDDILQQTIIILEHRLVSKKYSIEQVVTDKDLIFAQSIEEFIRSIIHMMVAKLDYFLKSYTRSVRWSEIALF